MQYCDSRFKTVEIDIVKCDMRIIYLMMQYMYVYICNICAKQASDYGTFYIIFDILFDSLQFLIMLIKCLGPDWGQLFF